VGEPDVILEARAVNKRFGGLRVLNDVSVQLLDRTLHSVIGPNGAGKSTLFDILSGVQMPDSGEVFYAGQSVTKADMWRRARAGVVRKFQAPSVFRELSVNENLQIAACGGEPLARLGLRRREDGSAAELLDRLGLTHLEHYRAGDLAHGEQQRLEIAMTLATRPRVLLLDEPAAGATQSERTTMAALLRELTGELSILVVEHDLRFIREVSDSVSVLDRGNLIAHGSVDEIANDNEVRAVFLGKQRL
jgi:urea transport system ATP-binding protein